MCAETHSPRGIIPPESMEKKAKTGICGRFAPANPRFGPFPPSRREGAALSLSKRGRGDGREVSYRMLSYLNKIVQFRLDDFALSG